MKRFYKETGIAAAEGGWQVTLDGKTLRSPAKAPLVLPTRALAEAIAAEWAAQADEIRPQAMKLMQLAATANDIVAKRRDEIVDEIAKYAETDLLCYRADHPAALAQRQAAAWQPVLDWVTLHFDAPLRVTAGVIPTAQPAPSLAALAKAVAACDLLRLTALQAATATCGSLVLGLALLEGRVGAEEAFALSQLDETWEIEQWGEDAEAMERRARIRDDVAAAGRFLELLGS